MVIESDTPPANPVADFEDFFRTFEEIPNQPKYRQKISEAYARSEHFVIALFEDILNFDPTLANYLKNKPEQALKDAADAFKNVLRMDAGGILPPDEEYFVRISTSNNSNEIKLRNIRAKYIDKLIYVRGIIIRSSAVHPQITVATFECPICGNLMQEPQTMRKLLTPKECTNPNCKHNKDFKIVTTDSVFIDNQVVNIQEAPEELRPGAIPQTLQALLLFDLVDTVRPGERVKVMGVLKSIPHEDGRGKISVVFNTQLSVNNIEGLQQEDDEIDITPQDLEEIHSLCQEPNIQNKIARSVGRAILGVEHLKLAAALALFGGVQKVKKDGSKLRGDIHVLFMGDPGTGKSQILQSCAQIASRSIYTSGKGASAAGLTAAVVRENDNIGMQLEAGALVLASGGTACIDEFDKMREADRTAIHEVMEQQSYHPSFEFTFSDKTSQKIGEFVDSIFQKYPDRKIPGIDCEILPLSGMNYKVLTTDFEHPREVVVNRVSRHKAPDKFVKITYSNGRSIIVTPEHPIYIYENQQITTKDAIQVKRKDFCPTHESLHYSGSITLNNDFLCSKKAVNLPARLDENLAKFLGYYVSEGYSYLGSSAEVGLSNTNEKILASMKDCIDKSFHITPIDSVEQNNTLRLISKPLFDYLVANFPQLMQLSYNKRIPAQIFCGNDDIRRNFLCAAFEGDGGVESTAAAYSTNSKGLAYDYQDLLSTFGIHSRITSETYRFGENKEQERLRYKVYITGDSLQDFRDIILPDYNNTNLDRLIEKSQKHNRKHDIVPAQMAELILKCYSLLGIPNDGYFYDHLKNAYGINKDVLNRVIQSIEQRISKIEQSLGQCKAMDASTISVLRNTINYSQSNFAELIEESRGTIYYIEAGGYNTAKAQILVQKAQNKLHGILDATKNIIQYLKKLMNLRWLRIIDIEIIDNKDEYKTDWVYDVTIEPTHNFIAHGVILHNTVSIAKAGIVATLQAKTTIIAAANPKLGRWNDYQTAAENINLSPPILSRFDLIFVVRDAPERTNDDRIAEYILRNHMEGFDETYIEEENVQPDAKKVDFIPQDLLKKYIRHAKNVCHPKLTRDTAKKIRDFYVTLRNSGGESAASGGMTMVARNLDGIVRMCEAYAKMSLRDVVTPEDVDVILDLVKRSQHDIGFDPETGTMDMDLVITGTSSNKRNRLNAILNKINDLQADDPKRELEFDDIFEPLATMEGINQDFVRQALGEWVKDGTLYNPHPNKYALTNVPKRKKQH